MHVAHGRSVGRRVFDPGWRNNMSKHLPEDKIRAYQNHMPQTGAGAPGKAGLVRHDTGQEHIGRGRGVLGRICIQPEEDAKAI